MELFDGWGDIRRAGALPCEALKNGSAILSAGRAFSSHM
jgi:hypothetical protein